MSVLRSRPFVTGILSGLAACLIIGGLGAWALSLAGSGEWYTVEVLSDGGDVTRQGGASLAIAYDHGGETLKVTCNGACDDIGYRAATGEDGLRLRVLDAQGACLVCQGGYVDSGTSLRLKIAGQDRLRVDAKTAVNGVAPKPSTH